MNIMNKITNTELLDKIKYNIKEDFPTEGVKFIDFMPTFSDLNLMKEIATTLCTIFKDIKVDYIVMPESRGYILGTLVANELGVDMIPVRKHGKLPVDYVGASYEYQTEYSTETLDIPKLDGLSGKTCIFIDDVYALGGTYYACKRLVEMCGANMFGGACIYSVGINENPEILCIMNKEDLR